MKVIVTGTTGMVGEGVLLAFLEDPNVERVVALSRRPSGHSHSKLSEVLVSNFLDLKAVEKDLVGYDGCFYGAGGSSVGMSEADYTKLSYDTPLAVGETLARLNPNMVFIYVSGANTDSSENGKVMWARVKGKAENALTRLPFRGVYAFRPGFMLPMPGQKNLKKLYRVLLVLKPLFRLIFPTLTLKQVALAALQSFAEGERKIYEVRDIAAAAARRGG